MSRVIVKGPVTLNGEVAVRGAKNAALPILVAAAMSSETVVLQNVPTALSDVHHLLTALRHTGARCTVQEDRVEVDSGALRETIIPAESAGRVRSSLLFLGLLLGKMGHARIALPGGCDLGARKYDLHIEGLRKLGAEVRCDEQGIEAHADGLVGSDIEFYLPTTTGTENLMIAACFARGRTRIYNANTRPEVKNLGAFLNAMGGHVTVRNRVVEIEPPQRLRGCHFAVMPGWDEALTYIIGSALTGGELRVKGFSLDTVQHDVAILRHAGVDVFEWGGSVFASARNRALKPFDLFTGPYPAVNSDMQPIFAALASQCHGESSITDQRFTERFAYAAQLRRLGAEIESYGNSAVIRGPCTLRGGRVQALDLRCGAALLLAALKAEGATHIEEAGHIGRGYEDVAAKMKALGADVEHIQE